MDHTIDDEKKRQRKWNPETLARLLEKGVDLHKPRSLINVFYVFAQDQLKRLEKCVEDKEMQIVEVFENTKQDEPDYWALHTEITLVPSLEAIHAMTDMCVDLAGEVDADYDGWYTEV